MSSTITGVYAVTPGCTNVGQIAFSVYCVIRGFNKSDKWENSLMLAIELTYRKTGVMSEFNCFGQTIKTWTLANEMCISLNSYSNHMYFEKIWTPVKRYGHLLYIYPCIKM